MDTQLAVQDVQNMISLIDTVATRGAFRGDELASVGQFRSRLVSVVEAEARAEPEIKETSPSQYPRDAIDAG